MPPALQQAISDPAGSAVDVSALGIQLTKIGDNFSPSLSADGSQIVFISQKRSSHSNAQVYLYDLGILKERRITYQDGNCQSPALLKDGRVVYASTTDELKEHPVLLYKEKNDSPYPPTDLYVSDLSGSHIERLTHRSGFDGFAWERPDKAGLLLYSQWDGKFLDIYQMLMKNHHTSRFFSKRGRSIESFRISPHGKEWAWIEKKSETSNQIFVSAATAATGKQRILELPEGQYQDLSWISDQKLIFSAKISKKYFQIYGYDLTTACLQNLVESNSDLTSPQWIADRNAVVFASSAQEGSQIFYKSLTNSDQCMQWQEPKSKPGDSSKESKVPGSSEKKN